MTDARLMQAQTWLDHLIDFPACRIQPLAGDASFRRYFRLVGANHTFVLMDAPPEKEDTHPFLNVCAWMQHAGLRVPHILHADQTLGFIILEDFGDLTWAKHVQNKGEMIPLFEDALSQLLALQAAIPPTNLPVFNIQRMQTECDLYLDWYLPYVEGKNPTEHERTKFHHALHPHLLSIDHLPKAAVHLDYHSRNLMLPSLGLPLGVIDFQDAVFGPITYDLASLLYDCYQAYDEQERRRWSAVFFGKLQPELQAYFQHDAQVWHLALRQTAMQRHIKAIGIFARLAYRDGKTSFLQEIPLTQKHLHEELLALNLIIPLI